MIKEEMSQVMEIWKDAIAKNLDAITADPQEIVKNKEHWTEGKKKLYLNGLEYERSSKPVRSKVYQKFVKAYEEYP
jgi:hypothetical protein